jgi:hypothetical protein
MKRGILYIVWGEKAEAQLQRSILSVRNFYPEMPIHVERGSEDPRLGFRQKTIMGALTPFESTLFLDADTVVLGNLDYAFDRAEEFGLACCICECPWLRRYGHSEGDLIEYNSGVLFFSQKARHIMSDWPKISAAHPSASHWLDTDGGHKGMRFEDQYGLARAIRDNAFNPHVLPMNYNFRPSIHRTFFAPLKIWHSPKELPQGLTQASLACEQGQQLVGYYQMAMPVVQT